MSITFEKSGADTLIEIAKGTWIPINGLTYIGHEKIKVPRGVAKDLAAIGPNGEPPLAKIIEA